MSQYDVTDTSATSGDKKTDAQKKVAKEQSGRKKLKVKIPTRIKASEIDNYPVAKTYFTIKPPFVAARVTCKKGNDLAGSYISVSRLRGPPQIV